jgi:hypothetical protein
MKKSLIQRIKPKPLQATLALLMCVFAVSLPILYFVWRNSSPHHQTPTSAPVSVDDVPGRQQSAQVLRKKGTPPLDVCHDETVNGTVMTGVSVAENDPSAFKIDDNALCVIGD